MMRQNKLYQVGEVAEGAGDQHWYGTLLRRGSCLLRAVFLVQHDGYGFRCSAFDFDFSHEFAEACGQICDACADMCEKSPDELAKQCAGICRRCAEECRKIAAVAV